MMVVGRLRPDRRAKYKTKSGRPKAPPRVTISGTGTGATRSQSQSRKREGSNSLLEQLPAELLQDIFLFSANLHLPLCSKQLLSALTSDHLKFDVTLQILVYQSHKLDSEERSLLLSRKFFTWEFVVRYTRFAQARTVAATDKESSLGDSHSEDDSALSHLSRKFRKSNTRERKLLISPPELQDVDRRLSSLCKNALEELHREEIGHLIEITLPRPALDELLQTKSLQGLQDLDLPEKILHNDWDDDRLRLLRLLISFNCTVNRMSPASAAAEEGILEAIEQGDEEVVSYLLGTHIDVQPATDMLRLAMMGSNVSIVFQLLRSGHGELDSLDPQVWKLLECHLLWEKDTKATIKKWLQKGIREPISEEDTQYLPSLREISEGGNRWASDE